MNLIKVSSKKTVEQFLDVPRKLYKGDPNWVCPLDDDIEYVFNPERNVFFTHGEAARWVLLSDTGELIGRVAAFINRKKAFQYQQPTGGMGFFECIEDQDAAFLLFDTCKEWLTALGMEAMDGPINFGENDNFWGLLAEGFMPQSFGMNYNPPYYVTFFENYGFVSYFEQITNHLDLNKQFPERFWKIADWALARPGVRFEHFKLNEASRFLKDMKEIYDTAWTFHENFTPLDEQFIMESLQKAKSFLVEEFIWFAYHEDKPAAFLIMFPDINQVLKGFNGKLNLVNKLKFLYFKHFIGFTRARITIMGVSPQYQRMGLESGIFWHLREVFNKKPKYNELELSWVGDFNLKMRKLHDAVGGYFAKKHLTYRKLFNDQGEKQRYTAIPVDTKDKFLDNH